MREIKFRAWDTFNERMVDEPYRFEKAQDWHKVEGDARFDTPFVFYEEWRDVEDGITRPCHIMQFAANGYKKNIQVWEGDILKDSNDRIWTIVWIESRAGFYMDLQQKKKKEFDGRLGKTTTKLQSYLLDDMEVIGNIYENPELLTP